MRHRFLLQIAAMLCAGAVVAVSIYLVVYQIGLRPKLVLELPKAECIWDFSRAYGAEFGEHVDEACRQHGVSKGPFFAIVGRKAVKFEPTEFHWVYGELITEKADPQTVYFYRYEPRYLEILESP